MNDWLIKIEQHDHEVREQYPEMTSEEFQSERMARVLRELAKGTSLLQEAVAKEMIDSLVSIVAGEFLDNLSPDAKVLVNE